MRVELHRRGQSSLWAVVDDDDYDLVSGHRWYVRTTGRVQHAWANIYRNGARTTIYMHTMITGWKYVDHKDLDGLNNRRSNLRVSDAQRNMRNSRSHLGATSTYKGVTWARKDGKWQAQIKINGKNFYLGRFESEVEAAHAYDTAARAHFGEHALLNFKEPPCSLTSPVPAN